MRINWAEVSEPGSGGYADLPTGGYVCRVTEVLEEQAYRSRFGDVYDRILIHYDVAEGEYEGFFAKNDKPDFTHEHEFRVGEPADERDAWRHEQFLDRFLPAVKASNDIGGVADTSQLKGLLFGATIRHRYYTKNDGSDGNVLAIQGFYSAERIRRGDFREPKDVDKRDTRAAQPAAGGAYDSAELPF